MSTNLHSGYFECPTIYVSLAPGVDEQAYHWVQIGAEEEGVPCLRVPDPAPGFKDGSQEALALANTAASGSRLGVGVGVEERRAVLQEVHMPAEKPVVSLPINGDKQHICRLIGSNAGRLVKRMPLRLALEDLPGSNGGKADDKAAGLAGKPMAPAVPISGADGQTNGIDIQVLKMLIARILRERGLV